MFPDNFKIVIQNCFMKDPRVGQDGMRSGKCQSQSVSGEKTATSVGITKPPCSHFSFRWFHLVAIGWLQPEL